jgi:hypothetical protein
MLFRASVANQSGDKISPYLLFEPRTLREVCRAKAGDDNGRRCLTCCVREFCRSQADRAGYGD